MAEINVEQAELTDVDAVSIILQEAAAWSKSFGELRWNAADLDAQAIHGEIAAGFYRIARVNGEAAGCVRYQLEDPLFWPDAVLGEAAYLHRLAVRRTHAGGRVSGALIDWAKTHARDRGHDYLRLDCDVNRPALRTFCESHGFTAVAEREVGPYSVLLYEFELSGPRDAG